MSDVKSLEERIEALERKKERSWSASEWLAVPRIA